MRTFLLLSSLTLGLFLLVPPVYAVNYSGDAVLDWSSLRISGIPITITGRDQHTDAIIYATPTGGPILSHHDNYFHDWISHTDSVNHPQGGSAISIADSNQLSSSVHSLDSTLYIEAFTDRSASFTAQDTGRLTVSIDYTLERPVGKGTYEYGDLELGGGTNPHDARDTASLSYIGSDNTVQSGTFTVSQLFQRGGTGAFYTAVGASTTYSVPIPDMLGPTLAGLIGLAVWAERRRRQSPLPQ